MMLVLIINYRLKTTYGSPPTIRAPEPTFHGKTKTERQKARQIAEQLEADNTQGEGVFSLLDIEPHFSIPRNPNGKSRVERWFGTLHEQFDKTFKSYCGSHHGDRPENMTETLKSPANAPTFKHVLDRLADYIPGYNAWADHSREDMLGWSPDAAIQAWAPNKRVFASEEGLRHCLQMWPRPKTVGKNGVSIQLHGMTIGFGCTDQALRPYKGSGKKVWIGYDPHDRDTLRVYKEDGGFITEAKRASPRNPGTHRVFLRFTAIPPDFPLL